MDDVTALYDQIYGLLLRDLERVKIPLSGLKFAIIIWWSVAIWPRVHISKGCSTDVDMYILVNGNHVWWLVNYRNSVISQNLGLHCNIVYNTNATTPQFQPFHILLQPHIVVSSTFTSEELNSIREGAIKEALVKASPRKSLGYSEGSHYALTLRHQLDYLAYGKRGEPIIKSRGFSLDDI